MKTNASATLTLLGKVAPATLKRFVKKGDSPNGNRLWLFVDYAPAEISLGETFDALFEGKKKRLAEETVQIKLLTVLDQMGNQLDAVPEGFQTVCEFDFLPSVPKSIQQLPELQTWSVNPAPVFIAHRSGIILGSSAGPKLVYSMAMDSIKAVFINRHSSSAQRDEVVKHIRKAFNAEKTEAEKIVGDMVALGFLDEEENQRLALVG